MYAKLVCPAQTWTVANQATLFNTVIGVITGTITDPATLNSSIFTVASSQIISTVAPGWTVHDSSAGTAILAGATPVVIKAPWSDDATKYKYLWVAPTYSVNVAGAQWSWIPAENWDATTNTSTNILVTPPAASSSSAQWYNCPDYIGSTQLNNGVTFVISASANHLFVWCILNTTGVSADFNSQIYISEYTRDDPWNTVANGYPSWVMTASNGSGLGASTDNGALPRILDIFNSQITATDANMLAANSAFSNTGINWGLTTRMRSNTSQLATADNSWYPCSLNGIGRDSSYWGNAYFGRDSAKAKTIPLSDIRVSAVSGSSNLFWMGGSLTAKAPYIYVFKNQWQSLDEVDISGSRYTNLICNPNATGVAAASTILVKQV